VQPIFYSCPPSTTTPMASERPPKRRRTNVARARVPSHAPKRFLVFHCQWEECDAELVNLELLKRHLMIIHTKSPQEKRFTCKWFQCGQPPNESQTSKAGGQNSRRISFSTEEEWQAHIDCHTEAVRQNLGWGPSVFSSGLFQFHLSVDIAPLT